jgi:DNA repair protein RecN (Recombination protein N)
VPATLRSLGIRNLALVERLDWELSSGFIAVTGETGAGKSIILGALKLVLGERADKSLIRTGAEQCSVEALFELDDSSRIDQMLTEQGIERCEENRLLLKRIFSAAGSNRQLINGSQTTLAFLKEIGDGLVDLHGPHDHQSLLARDLQLQLVDAFGDHGKVGDQYQAEYRKWCELREQLRELTQETSQENLDLWRHQLSELQGAALTRDELEQLENRYSVAANGRRIIELTVAIQELLGQADDSVRNRLAELTRLLRELERLDTSTTEFSTRSQAAAVELEDLERAIASYQDKIDLDPASLQQMEERLNLLHSLQRKYRLDIDGLIALTEELNDKLGRIDQKEALAAGLEHAISQAEERVRTVGRTLSNLRSKAAKHLAGSIAEHLADLGFTQSSFEIRIDSLAEPHPNGCENVEFLFAPNPGEPLKPLRAIASSGEISRVMLAVKTALAQQDLIGLLVFDEIDANVGGEIAHAVGAKMRTLGATRQVLTITHMPQVAAAAASHFLVSKETTGGRTRTLLEEVTGEDRIAELGRMLGGKSRSALEHARELLRANNL